MEGGRGNISIPMPDKPLPEPNATTIEGIALLVQPKFAVGAMDHAEIMAGTR